MSFIPAGVVPQRPSCRTQTNVSNTLADRIQTQAEGDAFAAYSGSCRTRRQRWITPEELQELSPWYFRFKRAAGQVRTPVAAAAAAAAAALSLSLSLSLCDVHWTFCCKRFASRSIPQAWLSMDPYWQGDASNLHMAYRLMMSQRCTCNKIVFVSICVWCM